MDHTNVYEITSYGIKKYKRLRQRMFLNIFHERE